VSDVSDGQADVSDGQTDVSDGVNYVLEGMGNGSESVGNVLDGRKTYTTLVGVHFNSFALAVFPRMTAMSWNYVLCLFVCLFVCLFGKNLSKKKF